MKSYQHEIILVKKCLPCSLVLAMRIAAGPSPMMVKAETAIAYLVKGRSPFTRYDSCSAERLMASVNVYILKEKKKPCVTFVSNSYSYN